MILLRASAVLTLGGPPVRDGVVLVDRGRVVAVFGPGKRLPAGEVIDLGGMVLLPGLINAHCHLDYTMLHRKIRAPYSFADWIRRINGIKADLVEADYVEAIGAGLEQLARAGITAVLNIASFPGLLTQLAPPPLRVWWCAELIDVRHPVEIDAVWPTEVPELPPDWLGGFGLSPHAPYTASVALFREAAAYCVRHGMPFTAHLAESAEEDAMFRSATGPLHGLLGAIGRPPHDLGRGSALEGLLAAGALPPGAILAHMNALGDDDFQLLAEHPVGRTLQVVHCPSSHRYFDHPPFAMERLRRIGVPISLGTDSLASADGLDLFVELRLAADAWPGLAPRQLLEMVTRHPAAALGQDGRLGCIAPGAEADLIAVPLRGGASGAEEAVLAHEGAVEWRMVAGRVQSTTRN